MGRFYFVLFLLLASVQVSADSTIKMDWESLGVHPNVNQACVSAEVFAKQAMLIKQKGVSKAKVLARFTKLIDGDERLSDNRILLLELAKRVVSRAYLADNVSRKEVDSVSKDFSVNMYNECLQGGFFVVKDEAFQIYDVPDTRVRLNPLTYGLDKAQEDLCVWFEENSQTALSHRHSGFDKKRVSKAFKRRMVDDSKMFKDPGINTGDLVDLIVDSAYSVADSPFYMRTNMKNDFGIYMFNKCVDGKVFIWR